jgi:hypothetical protein
MADEITYYALIDDYSSGDQPGGVLRRTENEQGRVDEVFSRALKWTPTPLLRTAESGDTMFEFIEITEDEATRIVERIRTESGEE